MPIRSRLKSGISLIIITKDRPKDLEECYRSLHAMTCHPNEFILIDSSSSDTTRSLTDRFSKTVPFPVHYIHEPRKGFPIARNTGLSKASYAWAAFTDDDCVVDPDFLCALKQAINKHAGAAAIAGESRSFYHNNLVSHVATFNENHWKSRVRKGDVILDLETLDNKNVAYNLVFLRNNGIAYDEKRTLFEGASDDCDLGMQIQQANGAAYYARNMLVLHKDLVTVSSYTARVMKRSSAHATYEQKWAAFRKRTGLTAIKEVRFASFFTAYIRTNNLSLFHAAALLFMLAYTSLLVRVVKLVRKRSS